MHTNSKLAKSIRLALMFGATATAVSGVAVAQDTAADEEQAERVERIQVTGSRIQRTDMEGALPVTVIDREAIELSGETSAAELLRNTTFNSAGSFRPQSGSSAQGVSQVNMRGLGAGRTLVLVDGRRLTMSPSTGSSQDLNSIPMGAIERIEILSDGASAIYGSDAIGGVINVITRRDFNGAELSIGKGEVSIPSDGGDRENGSLVFGSSSDTTSVIGGVSWNKREIIFENAFPWVSPGASTYGNNWRPLEAGGFGGFSSVPNGCRDDNFMYDADDDQCRYNFNATNANEASTENESLFAKVRHDFSDNWTLYSNASIAKTESFGRYAPAPDTNGYYPSLFTPADSYNNPTNPNAWFYDPNNPHAVAYDPAKAGANTPGIFYHRFAAMGNRDSTVSNENIDFLVGVEGRVGNFDLDFGVRRVRNKTYEIGNGYLAATTAWSNVNDFNPGYNADRTVFDPSTYRYGYDIQSPSDNPADVLAAGVVTTSRISQFNIDEMYASVGFDVFEIGGGMIQGFAGIESRDEYYEDAYDSQSEAGLVGGSAGNSAGGGRTLDAAYFEFLIPVTYDLEVSVAGRFDDYSDYGSDFSPKIGVRYQPMSNLMLRASYGKGFRAPSLDLLTMLTSFSADSVVDAKTCAVLAGDANKQCQINAYRIANPDLSSEESTQIALGAAYQPTDWMSLTADYYSIEIDNRIRSFGSQNLIDRELSGDPIPPGLGVSRDGNGLITEILTGYGNEGTLKTTGLDFNLRTNFDLGGMGSISNNLQMSHMIDYKVDGGRNQVKDPGVPANRIALQNLWTLGDFSVAWNLNFIGTQYTTVLGRRADGTFGTGAGGVKCDDPGAGIDTVRCGNVGSYTTHDLQFNYNSPWNGRFTVGVQNAFEKLPKISPWAGAQYGAGGRDYNFDLYNTYGRVTYVRYTQRF
ncbi:TonB-dependent receptor plug domain-containing protein [Aliidiomarina quisquiliarum]|uniref:TonB-dependent receptor plug domain-containing protein n=1 Tax=Aliidiomarina quisquiliarum TaxID=2938947 RepID=UPI00208DEF56|nr:TonB-dependent receptor [Aliidiomarina quisquiliarum]MCO4320213.1 TonB-dependent receptor [Aliidiomarina quisquiliarum]